MTPQPLESRVENLEERVTNIEESVGPGDPAEPQVLPLRTEMRNGFSAVRAELKTLDGRVTTLDGKVTALDAKVTDVSTHMRVLHEDMIERFTLMQEGQPRKPDA